MKLADQRRAHLSLANRRRAEVGEARAALRSGALPLEDVMADPPAALAAVALVDVIRWCRSTAPSQGRPAVVQIGQQAVRDDVNLLVPLGEASARSRAWVAQWGTRWKVAA